MNSLTMCFGGGGDFNWDPKQNSGFSLMGEAFMHRLGLHSASENYPVTHTYVHTDLVATSTLDHFMVDAELLTVVKDAGALTKLGDNLSRHSPMQIKLVLGKLPSKKKTEVTKRKRPAWYKAGKKEREDFKVGLNMKLQTLASLECLNCNDPHCKNESHSEEQDRHMIDIMSTLIECSHEYIPMVGGKGDKEERQVIPGWKKLVEPHREKAIFWHSIWQSCGRPNRGEVRKIMASTRNRYQYAVQKCKRLLGATKARKL